MNTGLQTILEWFPALFPTPLTPVREVLLGQLLSIISYAYGIPQTDPRLTVDANRLNADADKIQGALAQASKP